MKENSGEMWSCFFFLNPVYNFQSNNINIQSLFSQKEMPHTVDSLWWLKDFH